MAPKAKAADKKPEAEEAKKRKAAEAKEEPASKESKKEAEEEEKVEKEKDAPNDSRPKVKETVTFDAMDCTLNVLPTMNGNVLMSLSDGGMQFLIAGARANVGIKAGRYMFEAKVIEALNPAESPGNRGKVPLPRQLLRVGFSTADSQLILGETEDGVCFDAEGAFTADKQKKTVSQRFGKNQTMAVLLNLDPKSDNYNTVSCFLGGERFSDPQPLPENLKGKTLYPHVSYRSISVQVGFGPEPACQLPFKCRTLQSAAASDAEVSKTSLPKDGKYEVVFPVAFPDEGTFDWLDMFLEKHPNYVELSDRKIIDWASKSGLFKPKSTGWKHSNDKPEFNYGLTAMDDLSVTRVLKSVAPLVPRNYVVMEVKENLTKADRLANLKRFNNPAYKKVAKIVMGEPNDEYKKVVHARILKEKKVKAETEWKAKKAEKERKKALAAKQKQLADMRKKAEEQRKKAEAEKKAKAAEAAKKKKEEEEKKKKEAEAKKKAEAGEEAEDAEEETKEEEKEEAKEEEKVETKEEEKEEEKKEEEEEEEEETEPPPVELTEEDKKVCFRPAVVKDLTDTVLSQAFGKFTIPTDDEGFNELKFEWQSATAANKYLRDWVLERKKTSKMEDLKPSDWFKSKHDHFLKSVKEWQDKQKPFQKKAEAAKKAKEAEEAEGEENKGDDLDIFSIENICDIGNGEPLFVKFTFEDWALLTLRYELFLLHAAFKHDADDEERIGVHETNLVFYYNKYYHKQLTPKFYGKETNKDLVDFVKDTVTFDKDNNVLKSNLEPDVDSLDIFVKLTEESRRERQRRVDAGDETARIKFNPMLNQVSKPAAAAAKPAAAKPAVAKPATPYGAAPRPAWGPSGPYGGAVRPGFKGGAKGAW